MTSDRIDCADEAINSVRERDDNQVNEKISADLKSFFIRYSFDARKINCNDFRSFSSMNPLCVTDIVHIHHNAVPSKIASEFLSKAVMA